MKKETEINGRPALETDQPLSVQEANVWGLEAREKADSRKAIIERLRCSAGKRRERKPINPLETLQPDPSFRVKNFNPEADAFNVESSDGKKLLGKSLTNGNVRSGQKVRSFFTPNGQVLIDVKPKGRDIVIPQPDPNPAKPEPDIWAGTVALLFSRLQQETVDLTDRGLATGEETSWDWTRFGAYSSPNINSKAYVFAKRKDTLGDYLTGEDALNNVLKPDRLIPPGGSGSSGAAKDNLAPVGNSQDAVTVWFYIGELNDFGTDLVDSGSGQIFRVSGPSIYPTNENTEQGPGFCMEMYRQGSISVGLYPIAQIGQEPLTQHLSKSYPDLGGKIGYWGNIYTWHGMQDYTTGGGRRTYLYREYWSGIAGVPAYRTEQPETPTSTPPEWTPGVSTYSPWQLEDASWYRFGWEYPDNKIACMSGGAIVAVTSELTNSNFLCGGSVPNDKWYWSGGIGSSAGALDKRANYSSTAGMFVCWQGHKDHISMAQGFFQEFRTYWKIPGTVTKLRSSNPFGCELPPDQGGGYPPPPPDAPAQRFLSRYYGRLADIILQVHRQDDEPLQLKLPVEFAACIERREVLGGGSYGFGANYEGYKTANYTRTYSQMIYYEDPFCLELVHATMSMDKDYAYIDVFGGGDRIWEEPLTNPVPNRLGQLGFGGSGADSAERRMSVNPNATFSTNPAPKTNETKPRLVKDCFGFVHSFVVKLPTNEEKTLTIVSYQKYKRGQNIALTAPNPESEFDQKRYLIFDYRTEVELRVQNTDAYVTTPNNEFASFNGLPALVQVPNYSPSAMGVFQKTFYKEQIYWTEMDWLYWQLQEGPRQFNPANTVLPPGVSVEQNNATGVFFEFDKKFGRHARAECIIPATSYGYAGSYYGGNSPQYSNDVKYFGKYILFTSFSEQLRGNGLKENGILTKWYRISTSSFPVHGQLKRNAI